MVNRLIVPNPQFADSAGLPYANGKLQFSVTGSATPLATYSDSALTVPNANPIILDSAGRAGSVFLQNLAYKVQLFDVNNNLIWTADPVWSSDFSGVAQFQVNNGSPNGTLAGTAGTFGGLPSSVAWDVVNNILYVCTTTGSSSTAVWTAVNAATSSSGVIEPPTGRLTLLTATPVMGFSGDVLATGNVFYTPYVGNQVPICNGSTFTMQSYSELALQLTAGSNAANTIYDIFVFNNSGLLTLVTGPAWSSSAAGSSTRGTGAGTTQLAYFSGILVNLVQLSGKNGGNTFVIPALTATYLGSVFIDAAAGQTSAMFSYGQSRKFGIWNCYNRVPIMMRAGDGTASWVYNTNTWRASNNASANSITVFQGLAEEIIPIVFTQRIFTDTNSGTAFNDARIGIGVNSTSSPSGVNAVNRQATGGSGGPNQQIDISVAARHYLQPFLGINTITSLEITVAAGASNTAFNGTSAFMQLETLYRG